MMLTRCFRRAVALLLASTVLCGATAQSQGQAWPARQPIRFIVPYPPGGASDLTARLIGEKLAAYTGQSVIIDNRPGANGIIALDAVAKAPPDGYTLLMANLGPNAINAVVYDKLPYDPVKDFTPITLTTVIPLVVLVTPTLPVKSIKDLLAYARANPGKLTFASAGNGAADHMSGEMMQSMTGIKMLHVPYKGDAPGLQDVIAGNVSLIMPTLIGGMPFIKSGALRPIAVTGAKRSPAMSELPTVAESGIPNYEAVSWGGVMGPAGMPHDVVVKLNTEIVRILKMPDVAQKLQSMGAEIVGSSPDEFSVYLKSEVAKWGKVAHDNHIKLD